MKIDIDKNYILKNNINKNIACLKVDVIIPTYMPGEKFQILFKELQKQTVSVNKFIICESIDLFKEKNETETNRIFHFTIDKENYNHGETRNLAASKSNADYILFMTQDAIPFNNRLIENLLSGFLTNTACVYAKQVAYSDCNEIESFTRQFNYPNHDIIKDSSTFDKYQIKNYFCSNVCCIYDKKIFDSFGGFDANVILNEDEYFAYKAIQSNYNVVYKSDAIVYHSHNYSLEEYYKRNFDIAVSQVMRPEIFSKIKSEKEGIKLVIKSLKHFAMSLQFLSCIKVIIYSITKYFGYRKGKRYKTLNKQEILNSTMNKNFWRDYL